MFQRQPRMQNPFRVKVKKIGLKKSYFEDINHRVLAASWLEFFVYATVLYMGVNAFFAFLYYMGGEGSIINADPQSYWDAFLFSFQTSTTIGYGHFLPGSSYTHAVVILDTVTGLVFVAITTGLAFGKFSRPTAKVIFSKNCVVNRFHGERTLMFRLANARDSHIADAGLEVAVVMKQDSPEGDHMQRIYDLKLIRSHTPVFFMSWTGMHIIDEKSPLYNLNAKDMEEKNVRVVVSMTGIDDWTAQSVHANYSYNFSDIVFNKKFKDILSSDGEEIAMDYSLFHELK